MTRGLSIWGVCLLMTAGTRSASAAVRVFTSNTMTAAQVVPSPAGASAATGSCSVIVDDQTGRVTISGSFSGLNAPATGAAIYGPAGPGSGPAPILIPATSVPAATSGAFSGAGTLTPE